MSWLMWGAAIIAVVFLIGAGAGRLAERNAPPLGEFVDVDGARIHLVDLAPDDPAGPPIVLIHGASVNLRDMWLALGDDLAKARRVIVVDRPGRGYSTRPADGWRLDVQARLIHDALIEKGVERPVIVGQSFGGGVALAYALQYQREMSGLVLLASVSHEWPGDVAWYNQASGWPLAGFLLRRLVIPVYGPLAAKDGVIKSFAPDEAPENYYEKSGLTLLFRPHDFKNNAADLRQLKSQIIEMSRRYGELTLPMAIITGADDDTVSPTLHSAALAATLTHAEYQVLPDTGHALHHSETATIIDVIERLADRR
ncbi:MAG: alpha/beta hydrolase [Parvularculaceae bacterium]|nr:alpha/beta hydrolase [Parvularculaceae bacterium]